MKAKWNRTEKQNMLQAIMVAWLNGRISCERTQQLVKRLCLTFHIRWRDLLPEQQQWCADVGIVNGCGSRWSRWIVPDVFRSACNHHDFNYMLGKRAGCRAKADLQFMAGMVMESAQLFGPQCWFAILVAFVYYSGVRMLGWIAWSRK